MTDPSVAQTPDSAHETIEVSGSDDLAVAQRSDRDHEGEHPGVDPSHLTQTWHSATKGPAWSRQVAQAQQAQAAAAKAAKRAALPPTPRKPRKPSAAQTQLALEISKLALGGALNREIAVKLNVSEGTVRRYRKRPDFDAVCDRARQALRATSDDAAMVGRSEALETARAVAKAYREGQDGISASDAMKAAGLLTTASAPPSQTQRDAARKELLGSLSPGLKRQVLAELQASHAGYLDALSDDDLERMLAE